MGRRTRTQRRKWPNFLDAADTYPTQFDRTIIERNRVATIPRTASTYDRPFVGTLVSHSLVYAPLGLTDNIQIDINWRVDRYFGFICQVAPCGGINMAAGPTDMGFKPVQDVSLPAQYMQNMFRSNNIADCLDPVYYAGLASGLPFSTPLSDYHLESHWVRLRCVGGFMMGYFDNAPVAAAPIARPAHTVGVDGWGIDFIGIHYPFGKFYLPGIESRPPLPKIEVTEFNWTPYSGSL